jgi:predicted XRE-type DNA-binding protein
MAEKHSDKKVVTDSSGNIFADLKLPSSDEDILKVKIAHAISVTIERRGLTQVEAASILRTDQAKVSAIVRGRLKDFSTERLFNFLTALGFDVDVNITPRAKETPGRIRVFA